MPELSTAEALLRLLVAAGLGGAIGLERELRDHEAGFRTHLLVSLGACVFTLVSAYAWTDWTFSTPQGVVFDPTRIAAQIVTGIGFLGAGAIIVRGISVRGLTTAATLWVVAAIGMAAGTGYYAVGVGAALLVLISLGPLKLISTRLVARVRPEEAELAIQLVPEGEATRVLAAIEELGGEVSQVEFGDERTIDVTLRASRRVGVGAGGGGGQQARRRRARAVASVRALLASGNAHKLEELRAALSGWELELLATDRPYPPEDGATYADNARIKAAFGREQARDGWVLGRGLGDRGRRARRPAGHRVRPLGRGRRRAAARRARGCRRPPRPLRLRARRARPGRRGAARDGDARGVDRDGAPRRRGLRLRPDLRPGRGGADGGRARRRVEAEQLAPGPRRRRAPRSPVLNERVGARTHDVRSGPVGSWPRQGRGGHG